MGFKTKRVALTLVSPPSGLVVGRLQNPKHGFFLVLRSSFLVNGLAIRQCFYFLMLLVVESLTNQRFFLDFETRISGDLWSNKLLPCPLILPLCFRLVSNHSDFQYPSDGKFAVEGVRKLPAVIQITLGVCGLPWGTLGARGLV